MKLQLSPLAGRWSGGLTVETSRDIVSSPEASSVEDPGGVGDDPGVGHKPGVDPGEGHEPGVHPDVGDPLLLADAVQRQLVHGAGNRGEGHLGGGQPLVERHLLLLKVVRLQAGIVVPLDVF